MAKDFVISGTGQVIRDGDRVVVRETTGYDSGPGVLAAVLSAEAVMVRYDFAPAKEQFVLTTRLMREDDKERVRDRPLWCWS